MPEYMDYEDCHEGVQSKRNIEPNWTFEGTQGEIRDRAYKEESWARAMAFLVNARALRSDIPGEQFNCIEIHGLMVFGEHEQAIRQYHNARQECKNFLSTFIAYIAQLYLQRGKHAIAVFQAVLDPYVPEEVLNLVERTSSIHHELDSELYVTIALLRMLRKEHETTAELNMLVTLELKALDKTNPNKAPLHQIQDMCDNAVRLHFNGLLPNHIYKLFDLLIQKASSFTENKIMIYSKEQEMYQSCHNQAREFVNSTITFTSFCFAKLGYPKFFSVNELHWTGVEALGKTLAADQPLSPTLERAIAYAYSSLMLDLPHVQKELIVLPLPYSPGTKMFPVKKILKLTNYISSKINPTTKNFPSIPITKSVWDRAFWYYLYLMSQKQFEKVIEFAEKDDNLEILPLRCLLYFALCQTKNREKAIHHLLHFISLVNSETLETKDDIHITLDAATEGKLYFNVLSAGKLKEFLPILFEWIRPTLGDTDIAPLFVFGQYMFSRQGFNMVNSAMKGLEDDTNFEIAKIRSHLKLSPVCNRINQYMISTGKWKSDQVLVGEPLGEKEALECIAGYLSSIRNLQV